MMNENISQSEDQIESLAYESMQTFVDLIDKQTSLINLEKYNENYIKQFLSDTLRFGNPENLEDRNIYIFPNFTELDRSILFKFEASMEQIFRNNYALQLYDSDIYIIHCLYKLLCTDFFNTMIYFLNGLQKIDSAFNDTIPNWDKLSMYYFLNNIYKGNRSNKEDYINEYIQYVFSIGQFTLQDIVEVALLESDGNVEISAIYVEIANDRIICDDDSFFLEKIKCLIFSNVYQDIIVKLKSFI